MQLPFTSEQFLEVFKNYNQFIFPLQIGFYILAAITMFLVLMNTARSGKIINLILGFFWLWMGTAYHFLFFSTINTAAYLFGALFVVQGLLFLYLGVFTSKLSFQFTAGSKGWLATILVLYALIIYPLLGIWFGHVYPYSPTFGLPCPTTIFTLGVLLCHQKRPPRSIVIIPFLWSLLGFSAAAQLGIREDTGLLIAGILVTSILWFQKKEVTSAIFQKGSAS